MKSRINMKRIMSIGTVTLLALGCHMAHAAAQRTMVSINGNDANTATSCAQTAPCRTFLAAMGVTVPGGEVVALDSGGFGAITITQAITITGAPGAYAAISATLAYPTAINVNAGASDKVVLRNLHLDGNGAGPNSTGIQVTNGTVVVMDSEITRFAKGVNVTTGSADLRDVRLTANTVAVRAVGQGPDQDANTGGITPRVSVVRVSRSTIVDNATAFAMVDPGSNPGGDNTTPGVGGALGGTRSQGSNNAQNIFLNNEGNTNTPNSYIAGNTTFLTVTGNAEFNGTTASTSPQLGYFASQSQNYTSVANQ